MEVGRFGRGESGKVWFGWEAQVESGDDFGAVLDTLSNLADSQEMTEKAAFEERRTRGDKQ